MTALVLAGGPLDFLGPVGQFLRFPFEVVLGALYRAMSGVPVLNAMGAFGISIILLTILIKTLLFPLFQTQLKLTKKTQTEQKKVAPELAELRKKYKKDPQKLNAEMMKLYKEHGINPLSPMIGCLPTLAQMPIIIGLYQAVYDKPFFQGLHASGHFLWVADLSKGAQMAHPIMWILPLLAGATTFVQSKMMTPAASGDPADSQAAQMAQVSSTMSLLMPLFIIWISFNSFIPQAAILYWIVSNLYSIGQQYRINGWGQLPFLGSRSSGAGGNGKDSGNGKASGNGKDKSRSRSAKVLVGQTEMSGRRNRRR